MTPVGRVAFLAFANQCSAQLGGDSMKRSLIAALAVALAGCSTVSFSPGLVEPPTPESENLAAANALTRTFIEHYRERASSVANGRQFFQAPSAIGTIGATTALALGASSDVAVGAGALSSLLGTGNAYYAPAQKRAYYSSALDALLCIEARMNNLAPFSTVAGIPDVPTEATQYALVRNAVLTVDRYTADRIANAGSFAGFGALEQEYRALIEAKQEDVARSKSLAATHLTKAKTLASDTSLTEADLAKRIAPYVGLSEDLQLCVLRAKA